ncbi:hypothetical protein [Stieleria maiorica]|uniref:hypothetical protein n=1 Tax=Stieleria maiorica TaxID=2795974 RepID=UPI001F475BD1|nr:hypothetical protein [Stieleria maiorica]
MLTTSGSVRHTDNRQLFHIRRADGRQSAPTKFADPEPKLNARRDLVVDGEAFRWQKGKGNYVPHPKYLPYTDPAMKQKQPQKQR